MRQMRNGCNTLAEKPEGKDHLEDLNADGRIKLKCILQKYDMM
jgi:hypothetical protein